MTKFKKVTDAYGMKVFTDTGYFFGEIDEAVIEDGVVKSWKIKAISGSIIAKTVKNAKGVVIPHRFFKAFGDIILVENIDIGGKTSENTEPKNPEEDF